MKKITVVVLLVSQTLIGAQASAASLESETRFAAHQTGAFAGARLRIPFGGIEAGKPRASLAVAPTLHGQRSDGSVRTRYGAGMELGLSRHQNVQLSLAGRPVSQLAAGPAGPDGVKLGASTTEGLLIVAGIVVLALGGVALLLKLQE